MTARTFAILALLLTFLLPACGDEGSPPSGAAASEGTRTPYFGTVKDGDALKKASLLQHIDNAATLQSSASIRYPFCIYSKNRSRNVQTENTENTENNVLSWAQTAMNTWIAPLVGQPQWRVSSATAYRVKRTGSRCPSLHNGLRVYVIEIKNIEGGGNATPGLRMWLGGRGVHPLVVLHEMGHGIGLADTRTFDSGDYKPVNQPDSTMKKQWSLGGVLQQDDIDAIRFLWARLRGDEDRQCPDGYVKSRCIGSHELCSLSYFCVSRGGGGGDCRINGQCSSRCRCSAGQGDCDSDSECQPGLYCKKQSGTDYCRTRSGRGGAGNCVDNWPAANCKDAAAYKSTLCIPSKPGYWNNCKKSCGRCSSGG